VSPDGRWIAYGHAGSGSAEPALTIVSSDPANAFRLEVPDAGRELRWSRDGHELFYRTGGVMYAIPLHEADGKITAGQAVELFHGVFELRPGFRANYDVLPDGRFLMLRRQGGTPAQQIIVSLNWKNTL